jgi:hypothetical protein
MHQGYHLCSFSVLKVRERGKFWLRRIHLEELTVAELYSKIKSKYSDDKETGDIFAVYELWDRTKTPIKTDAQVQQLLEGHELEVIFERPASSLRGSYSLWWQTKFGAH